MLSRFKILSLVLFIGYSASLLCAIAGAFERAVEEVKVYVNWVPFDNKKPCNQRKVVGRSLIAGSSFAAQ